MDIELQQPNLSRENDFMAMVEEFQSFDEAHFIEEDVLVKDGFAKYVTWLHQGEQGKLSDQGLVPWSAYWAIDVNSNTLVGVSSLRHELSPWLAQYGGHIGYRVRPSMRQRGVGTKILALTLRCALERGIEQALVICQKDNAGSVGVIHNNGGILESEVSWEGRTLCRFWVPARVNGEDQ